MNCLICEKPLTGGIDTFGDRGQEVCRDCWFEHGYEPDMPESWYGLGPHEHSYDENGQIIFGGTTFKPLPKPNANGEIVIGNLTFTPDPEAPGCGIWSRR